MIPPPSFKGRVVNGRVVYDKEAVQRYISGLEGREVLITIAQHYGKRTLRQNAYSWVVYEYISQHTGYEPLEVKTEMQKMFLIREDRRGKLRVRGTSTLNRAEFNEFLERVIRWAALYLDLVIPDPDTVAEIWEIA